MVLLPCSNCCQPPCTCPACTCCQCVSWQAFFDYYATYLYGQKGYWIRPDEDLSLYDGLYRAGVCNLTRAHESKSACVTACQESLAPWGGEPYPGFCSEDGGPCGDIYIFGGGWSAPLVDGVLATPEILEELCPSGANPPDFTGDGLTHYAGTPQFTGAGTPDIARLVFKSGQSTGDPIADALFARGTRNDLPAVPWQEADDCGSCGTPPAYEYDCDSATDDKRFYAKTVTWAHTYPAAPYTPHEPACPLPADPYTGITSDPLGLCPPQNCKEVTITVTRTDRCASGDVVTVWKAIVYVCPCLPFPIIGVDYATGDLWEAAYGYDSEADCIAEWNSAHCIGNQWKQVRHEIDGTARELMPQNCCTAGGGKC